MSLKVDLQADVVVVGAGAAGLPAAIAARERGASAIVVEANYDVGGHAIQSGGYIALGGGTSLQRKHGIRDSADSIFEDLTSGTRYPEYRYNDRRLVRAFADASSPWRGARVWTRSLQRGLLGLD